MGKYFDKYGKPLSLMEWGDLMGNIAYKRIAETTLPDGKWVSTVWLGLDHNWQYGRPLIFETMVFSKHGDGGELDMERYSTLEEAEAGHKKMVEKHTI